MVSEQTKKEIIGLPEKRILKTVQTARPQTNPLIDNKVEIRPHFHCAPQVDYI